METRRLEALSDGIFAIALTLLILEVRLPEDVEEGGESLWQLLGQAWPAYVGYALSFVIIGIMWANHHAIFQLIGRATHGLVLANLGLMLCVAFLPFPTKILSEHLRADPVTQQTATAFYSGMLFVTACFYSLVWQTAAYRNRLIRPGCEAAAAAVTQAFRWGPPVYLGATVAAWISVPLSLAVDAGLAVAYLLPRNANLQNAPR